MYARRPEVLVSAHMLFYQKKKSLLVGLSYIQCLVGLQCNMLVLMRGYTEESYHIDNYICTPFQPDLLVPDTLEDPRFRENGLVTGPPHIRFYAGAPLITPSRLKLGTFCIIDSKPRKSGLTLSEKQSLRELTEMVMDNMVNRKQEMDRLMDEKTRVIACAAHDILSPITGMRLNMEMLMEDTTLQEKLDDNQKEIMTASVKCSDMIERIW